MSGSNTQRVGEIFKTAGQAFNTLGQLTSQLESSGPNATKWTDQEVNLLARAVQNFANDLELISDTIRSRTVSQIKGALQKKAYEAAGIEVQSQPQQIIQNPTSIQNSGPISSSKQNADVTLAALNASESEVDVEDMGTPTDSSLDFDSATDVKL